MNIKKLIRKFLGRFVDERIVIKKHEDGYGIEHIINVPRIIRPFYTINLQDELRNFSCMIDQLEIEKIVYGK